MVPARVEILAMEMSSMTKNKTPDERTARRISLCWAKTRIHVKSPFRYLHHAFGEGVGHEQRVEFGAWATTRAIRGIRGGDW